MNPQRDFLLEIIDKYLERFKDNLASNDAAKVLLGCLEHVQKLEVALAKARQFHPDPEYLIKFCVAKTLVEAAVISTN